MNPITPRKAPADKRPTMHETLAQARTYFAERAESEANDDRRELYDQLRHVVDSLRETASLVAHLKTQVEEVHHGMGMHLERTGSVPHTRRRTP